MSARQPEIVIDPVMEEPGELVEGETGKLLQRNVKLIQMTLELSITFDTFTPQTITSSTVRLS
jgi:hypothetical protein